jgi:hypothetical protein
MRFEFRLPSVVPSSFRMREAGFVEYMHIHVLVLKMSCRSDESYSTSAV